VRIGPNAAAWLVATKPSTTDRLLAKFQALFLKTVEMVIFHSVLVSGES
jgi:hypothetical protein